MIFLKIRYSYFKEMYSLRTYLIKYVSNIYDYATSSSIGIVNKECLVFMSVTVYSVWHTELFMSRGDD